MPANRITYVAITPAGHTNTRSSATMAYTHALVVIHPDDDATLHPNSPREGVVSWHKTEAAARKAETSYRNRGYQVQVVPVELYPYSSPAAKASRELEKSIYGY